MDNVNLLFVGRIIRVFSKDIFLELTIRQLSKKAGLSYNATHRTVKHLVKEGVFEVRQFGKSSVLSLSMSQKAIGLLCMESYNEAEEFISGKKKLMEAAEKALNDDSAVAYVDLKKRKIISLKKAPESIDISKILIIKGAEAVFRKTRGGRK